MNIPTTKQLEKLLALRLRYETYKSHLLFEMDETPLRKFRRRAFYLYPNGAAPLISLMSMLEENKTQNE